MRILLAHNFYRTSAPSGEDVVFRNEHELLERHGIEVVPYVVHNDDLDDRGLFKKIRIATKTVWSGHSSRRLGKLLASSRPDLVHFHNTFPQISPSAYAACRRAGVPVVQTLHNYRLICPGALLLREGVPCESCVGTTLLPAVRHRCYRGSLSATATVALMLSVNRQLGSYSNNVDRYIALTEFAASRLRAGGLPGERISVKPNFLPDDPQPGRGGGGYAVFVGRLSSEKGVLTLLRAWRHLPHLPLKILGDGPLRGQLERQVASERLPVELLGFRSASDVRSIVGEAVVQIVPSECYEGFPMVLVEAFALGTPVIASGIGSLEEIIREGCSGLKFRPGDADDLVRAVSQLMKAKDFALGMRGGTRKVFERFYTAGNNFDQLMSIYRAVLTNRDGVL